jgi:hypothetical protein
MRALAFLADDRTPKKWYNACERAAVENRLTKFTYQTIFICPALPAESIEFVLADAAVRCPLPKVPL